MQKALIIGVFYGSISNNDEVDRLDNSMLEDKGVL